MQQTMQMLKSEDTSLQGSAEPIKLQGMLPKLVPGQEQEVENSQPHSTAESLKHLKSVNTKSGKVGRVSIKIAPGTKLKKSAQHQKLKTTIKKERVMIVDEQAPDSVKDEFQSH